MKQILESQVEGFDRVCAALVEIRDRRLYRGDFATFEDFCRAKVQGFDPARLDELMKLRRALLAPPQPEN